MTTTNVPSVQFTPTGLVVPTEAAILAGVQADFNAAFNGNLNPALNTPQGQLASSQAACIANADAAFAEIVNQVDPDNATGFMQDAIGRIYFLNRIPGTPTVVQCQCVGALGTVIPVGAQAQDTSGNLYTCTQAGTIPSGGTITLPFANVVLGPIGCAANTLTAIYQAIPGWDTINNSAAGVTGSNVESPAAFEYRREQSVALNAHGSLPSIYAAVFDVDDVIDVYATENTTGATIYVGSTSYALVAHSLYVGVAGGAAQDIATAIWTKKDVGCAYNGNTTETVTDPSGYQQPYPTYSVTFQTLVDTPIYFAVRIANSTSLPSNIVALSQAAIIAQFTGQNGGQRARAGAYLLASTYYGPVVAIGPEVSVLSILIGTTFTGTATLVSASTTLTVASVTGTIAVGCVLTGTDIPTGTVIVNQLTGPAGGVGTYMMSAAATGTVGSAEAISGAPGYSVLMGIDQEPTTQASYITVTT